MTYLQYILSVIAAWLLMVASIEFSIDWGLYLATIVSLITSLIYVVSYVLEQNRHA